MTQNTEEGDIDAALVRIKEDKQGAEEDEDIKVRQSFNSHNSFCRFKTLLM